MPSLGICLQGEDGGGKAELLVPALLLSSQGTFQESLASLDCPLPVKQEP